MVHVIIMAAVVVVATMVVAEALMAVVAVVLPMQEPEQVMLRIRRVSILHHLLPAGKVL